ncbi:ANKRD50 [Symbiodinium sp. KB8]|nr:ANKRD50 [Symbiodinium sp. KB8]
MLEVRMLSGEVVARHTAQELEELGDVRSLKRHLNQFHGVGTRFRQRLFLHGEMLEDRVKLESSMDLNLVLLPLADVFQSQADDLVAAAELGSVAEVESMLQLPQDPDLLDSHGRAALICASYEGHLETVHLLLEAAANKDVTDDDGSTALSSASGEGHVDIVRLLLEAGTEKDVAGRSRCTALINASLAGQVEIVRLLLDAGARKDVADGFGRTALTNACKAGHVEIVRLLLEGGAKDVASATWCTALTNASRDGHVEIVRLLLEAGTEKDVEGRSRRIALNNASHAGHVDIVRLLLDAGALMDVADGFAHTALTNASHAGHVEIVRLLLEAGVNSTYYADHVGIVRLLLEGGAKDVASATWCTLLTNASRDGHVEIVRLLLEAGTEKDVEGRSRRIALNNASLAGHVEIVRLLLDAGARKDVADGFGRTALTNASNAGHVEIVRLLLDAGARKDVAAGARTDVVNIDGFARAARAALLQMWRMASGTVLNNAFHEGHTEIVRLLLEFLPILVCFMGQKTSEQMLEVRMLSGEVVARHTAEELEELGDVRSLKRRLNQLHGVGTRFRQRLFLHGEMLEDRVKLESSMDLNLVVLPLADVSQSQADDLVAAAERGSVDEVESMLQLPQDPDLLDSHGGRAALIYASYGGHLETVHLLLEAAANKDVADDHGYTALNRASGEGHVEIVRLLLEAGANMDVADVNGFTALNRTVRVLLHAGALSLTDVVDGFGFPALTNASHAGHVEIVRLLLEAGGKKDVAAALSGVEGRGRRIALNNASHACHVEIVRLLLDAGALKDVADGLTALAQASHAGHVEIVRLLLDAGARIHVADTFGRTSRYRPPHIRNKEPMWRMALGTALNNAFREGHTEIVRLLLEAGVDKDMDYYGLLGLPAYTSDKKEIKELGELPPDAALREEYSDVLSVLKEEAKKEAADIISKNGRPSAQVGDDEERGVFVDETACSRCYKCVEVASSTFAVHRSPERGEKAHAVVQDADATEILEAAVRACPSRAISFVKKEDVPLLDLAMRESATLAHTSGVLRGPWEIFQEYVVEDIVRMDLELRDFTPAKTMRDAESVAEIADIAGEISTSASAIPEGVRARLWKGIGGDESAVKELEAMAQGTGEASSLSRNTLKADLFKFLVSGALPILSLMGAAFRRHALPPGETHQPRDTGKMLHIWTLSGELVTGIPTRELPGLGNVRGLKQHLHQFHGVASRFRQRFLLQGECLEDTALLRSAAGDLYLVLLPFAEVSGSQINDFVAAAGRGSVEEVESMLQLPLNPDLFDANGRGALMRAVINSHVAMVRLLLEADPNKDVADNTGQTVLMIAADKEHVEIVCLLLQAGANTDLRDTLGCTALITATYSRRVKFIRLLLEAGADQHVANHGGYTALTIASVKGFAEVVRLLLDAGTNKDLTSSDGQTALICATIAGHVDVVRLLLEAGANRDLADNCDHTALMIASSKGLTEIVRLLLENGASKDLANSDGHTALMFAVVTGHVEIVRLLLKACVNKDLADNLGRTALMKATEGGHINLARLLLEAGASKDLADKCGHTALMIASDKGRAEVVRLLLQNGVSKDLANNDGHTALICAVVAGHVEIVGLLLEAGANRDVADNLGRTALMRASENGHFKLVRLLLVAGADKDLADTELGRTALMSASERGLVRIVRLLLEAGANKDLADKCGHTALMIASHKGLPEIVPLLLENGANEDATGRDEIVCWLLEARTNKNLAENSGCTALMNEAMGYVSGQIRLVVADGRYPRTVISTASAYWRAGAKRDLAEAVDRTAPLEAFDHGRVEFVGLLPEAGANLDLSLIAARGQDVDGNGFLYSEELRGLASELGFEGSDSEWSQEYVMICSEVGCNPAQGMDFRGFSQFVDDEEAGYLEDAEIAGLLGQPM